MENISFETVISAANGEEIAFVIIDRGNGEFTSMPKAVWDELEAKRESGEII